ncbi:hypothetical protein HON36_00525 [Candidatus Parcubacteria bacterium]|nr:hypothetical protein [Candidatus Parcubacteria bacterium]
MTQGQTKQIKRFAEDAIDGVENLSTKDAQHLIEHGDEFQRRIIGVIRSLSPSIRSFPINVETTRVIELFNQGGYARANDFSCNEPGQYVMGDSTVYLLDLSISPPKIPLGGSQTLFQRQRQIIEESLRKMEEMGFIPANVIHLLTLGNQHPFIQYKSIVALGTKHQDSSDTDWYPYIGTRGSRVFGGLTVDSILEEKSLFLALRAK